MKKYRVKVISNSENLDNGYEIEDGSGTLYLNSDIYNNLKSPLKCENVGFNVPGKTSYDNFIFHMSILHDLLILEIETDELPIDIVKVDAYLGQLMEDHQYIVEKDIIRLNNFNINLEFKPSYTRK